MPAATTSVRIRRATRADALRIRNLHVRSIRGLCRREYTRAQITAWTTKRPVGSYRWAMTTGGERTYVATVRDRPVAFGAVRGAEMRAVYVDTPWAAHGVGARMLARLERDAVTRGERRLWLDATLTAVAFYERYGWRRRHRHALTRNDVPIPCIRMTKTIRRRGRSSA
jgi:GNAT superfamily N-acetyltransferase